MNKKKIFSPPALKNNEGMIGFAVLSASYFKVAQELRESSKSDKTGMPGHFYVFPSVIMYVSALEAFFSEYLALVINSNKDDEELTKLKAQERPYDEFKNWLKEIFINFNRIKKEINYEGELFQNVIALKELRNSAAHYNPNFINYIYWPQRLRQVLNKSKIEVINSGWVTNLSRPVIADWAYETTKDTITEFCDISGWENPFKATYPHGWETTDQ